MPISVRAIINGAEVTFMGDDSGWSVMVREGYNLRLFLPPRCPLCKGEMYPIAHFDDMFLVGCLCGCLVHWKYIEQFRKEKICPV